MAILAKRGKTGSKSLNKVFAPGSYTVAQLPTAAPENAGAVVYCSNGSAGAACVAISTGALWKVVALGATVSAT